MANFKLFILHIIIIFCSCKNTNPGIPYQAEKAKNDNIYFSKKPGHYYYTYNVSMSNIENFNNGYIDTFSANGIKFQLLSNPDSLGDLDLQVMKNGKWRTNLKLPYAINSNQADVDINKDGFNDFRSSLLRGSDVYLFDKIKKQFHTAPVYLSFKWSLIDSAKNLYANNYSGRDFGHTDLFVLNGFTQKVLYTAKIELHIDSLQETGFVRLYKLNNGNIADTVLVERSRFNNLKEGFDYKKYWLKMSNKI